MLNFQYRQQKLLVKLEREGDWEEELEEELEGELEGELEEEVYGVDVGLYLNQIFLPNRQWRDMTYLMCQTSFLLSPQHDHLAFIWKFHW